MTYPYAKLYPMPELRGEGGRALLACGFWLRVGFIGASAAVVGLFHLFGGETGPLSPFALTLGGGALAVLGWRRAYAALQRADTAAENNSGEAPAGSAVRTPAVA